MGKRADQSNDATMEVSDSQFLKLAPKPPARGTTKPPALRNPPAGSKNDASVWKQVVVSTDEFAPQPKTDARPRRWWIFGLVGAVVLAAVGFTVYWISRDDKPAEKAAGTTAPPAEVAPEKPPAPAPAKPAIPEVAATPPAPAPSDEGIFGGVMIDAVETAVTAPRVDAMFGGGPVKKPAATKTAAVKKAPVTRPPVKAPPKKKPVTAPKR